MICHASGPYIISQGTFPSYFLKEEAVVCEAHAKLDIAIFKIIARELGITNRFVGEEKKSMVTSMYNRVMLEQLNKVGIKAEEIPRKKINEEVISASKVRQWIHDGQLESVCPFVPKTTWEYLYSEEARPVLEAIAKGAGRHTLLIIKRCEDGNQKSTGYRHDGSEGSKSIPPAGINTEI